MFNKVQSTMFIKLTKETKLNRKINNLDITITNKKQRIKITYTKSKNYAHKYVWYGQKKEKTSLSEYQKVLI